MALCKTALIHTLQHPPPINAVCQDSPHGFATAIQFRTAATRTVTPVARASRRSGHGPPPTDYTPKAPAQGVLYRVVCDHVETFRGFLCGFLAREGPVHNAERPVDAGLVVVDTGEEYVDALNVGHNTPQRTDGARKETDDAKQDRVTRCWHSEH